MNDVLAHAGHSHGLDLGQVALLVVGLLLGVWAARHAWKAWRQ